MDKLTHKDIWDVMFALDKKYFPLSRNYLQQPRGSGNFINSQVQMEPNKQYLDFAKTLNPVDLYALDFELNLAIRRIADVVKMCSGDDIYDDDFLNRVPEIDNRLIKLFYRYNDNCEIDLEFKNILIHIFNEIEHYNECVLDEIHKDEYDPIKKLEISPEMRKLARLQFALEYYIEQSDIDWCIKAEAFLRSQFYNDFKLSDNETLIHISHKDFLELAAFEGGTNSSSSYADIKNRALNEGYLRWEQYRQRWDLISLNFSNPFEGEPDDLSALRFADISNIRFLHKLLYKSEYHNLSSSPNIKEFCLLLNNFRTDLSAIKVNIPSIYEHLKHSLSLEENTCPYEDITSSNYVLSAKARMFCIMFFFLIGRLSDSPHDKKQYNVYSHLLLTDPSLEVDDDTFIKVVDTHNNDNIRNTPWISLVCFNTLAIQVAQPKKYVKDIETFFGIIRNEQSDYGYWYDGSVNPEFMTVLALEALDIGRGKLTFSPNKFKLSECRSVINRPHIESEEENEAEPWVEYDIISRVLTVGDQKIILTTTILELMVKLINARYLTGHPPESTKSYKYAVDFLRKKLKYKDALKYIIKSRYAFSHSCGKKKKVCVYELAPNVIINKRTSVKTSSADMDKLPARKT